MGFKNLRTGLLALAGLILILIALGGATRAMNAGLACPDWPLCFGQLIPDFHPQVYFEFIHRAVAGLIAILTVAVAFTVFRHPQASKVMKRLMGFALVILVCQILMGGLTVLKLLHFSTVTLHLALGVAFFASMLWMLFSVDRASRPVMSRPPMWARAIFIFSAIVVYGQILLGGLVSSNYAGMACPDFPLCNGQWAPTWDGPVGLHVAHRFGAYFTAAVVIAMFWTMRAFAKKSWMNPEILKVARGMISLVLLQIALGVANVKFAIPPVITVFHLLVAVGILGCALRLIFVSQTQEVR